MRVDVNSVGYQRSSPVIHAFASGRRKCTRPVLKYRRRTVTGRLPSTLPLVWPKFQPVRFLLLLVLVTCSSQLYSWCFAMNYVAMSSG